MPAKDQARGQCNDHYRNVVELAGTVGAAVENNRDEQHNEAYSQPAAGLDNTHGAAPGLSPALAQPGYGAAYQRITGGLWTTGTAASRISSALPDRGG